MQLPTRNEKVEFESFKKSWRSWYLQTINTDAKPETRERNKGWFDYGKKHLEELGYQVTENDKTGRVKLVIRDKKLYDTNGIEISSKKKSVGAVTGWSEYEFIND